MSIFLIPDFLGDEIQKMMNSFWWGSKGGGRRGINWLSWDKLSMNKKHGGMGFHNLYVFNISLLAKQGWRLMTNPNNLTAKLFKAKYFPSGDFMGSSLGHNPSFTWRSIWNSSEKKDYIGPPQPALVQIPFFFTLSYPRSPQA